MKLVTLPHTFALALLATSLSAAALAQPPEKCRLSEAPPFATAADARDALHPLPHSDRSPHVAFHGQGVHGTDTVYFNHLGIFMRNPERHPHAFQALLEVEFEEESARETYLEERAAHLDTLYTAVPPRFDITALAPDASGSARLGRLIDTTFFRGHFEHPGRTPVIEDTPMRIARVVHFREFEPEAELPAHPHYLLFGRGDDTFVASLPIAPPAWDQTSSVELTLRDAADPETASAFDEALAGALHLALPERGHAVEERLREDEVLECLWERADGTSHTVSLRVGKEHYCEQGELSAPVIDVFNRPERCTT